MNGGLARYGTYGEEIPATRKASSCLVVACCRKWLPLPLTLLWLLSFGVGTKSMTVTMRLLFFVFIVLVATWLPDASVVGATAEQDEKVVVEEEQECVVDPATGEQVCESSETITEEQGEAWNISDMLKQAFGGVLNGNNKQQQQQEEESSSFSALQDKQHSVQKKDFLKDLSEILFHYNKDDESTSSQDLVQSFLSALTVDLNKTHAGIELFQLCLQHSKRVKEQFSKYFDDIGLDSFNPVQLYYYMLHEESTKNSVWKRKQHRFLTSVPIEEIQQLGDGMYLSQLSYADTCEDVYEYAKTFRNDTWKVVDCTTKSKPFQPAGYLMVPRETDPDQDFVEVVLVVRATKEFSDIISDALLEAAEYRQGKTHQGMMESGRFLHDKYKEQLFEILETSGKSKLKLMIIGHSLGGGAAQLTATEFMDYEKIDAYAVGYGAPAVFTPEMSAALAINITSVITDADVVARMSGASVANAWLRVLGYNFTEDALQDVDELFPILEEMVAPYGDWTVKTLRSLREMISAKIIKDAEKQLQVRASLKKPVMTQELFPAGDCIHLYRDGSAWQGVYIPCTRFDEIEVVKKMVDDHMTASGYYNALLGYARELMDNENWNFPHDIRALPVQL